MDTNVAEALQAHSIGTDACSRIVSKVQVRCCIDGKTVLLAGQTGARQTDVLRPVRIQRVSEEH